MEVREPVHSPPFWASSSNASIPNPSTPSSPYSRYSSSQSGIRPWIIVLVFSIVVLLFLPSVLSTPFKSGRFNLSIKSGWDMLNLCLVVFAIVCGVLGRIGEGSRQESGSYKQQPRNEWTGYSNPLGDANRMAGMRRIRNSSSYPDLRMETGMWDQNRMPDSWRFYDDGELYRARRPVQLYQVAGSSEEERECKTISVDTERFPQMEPVGNETNFEEGTMESEEIYEEEREGREAMVVRRRRRSLEALPKWEVEIEPKVVAGRQRRRSLERFPSIEEAEKETNFKSVEVEVEEEKVEKRPMVVRRRRKSLENFPKMNEIEEATKAEEEMVEKPPAPDAVARRAKSTETLPEIEEIEKGTNFEENVVEKTPSVAEVAPPPPPPPPPPLPESKAEEECRKHKRSGSGGGAKDLASAIALFYQKKKKGNKSKRKEKHEPSTESNPNSNSVTESNSNPSRAPSTAPAPPPPPPPPPASIFHQLFSNKKGGSKSRRIHSLSASTYSSSPSTVNTISTPPASLPPPPHQTLHRSRKDEISSSGYRRIEDTELYEYRRRERSNLSPYVNYPLPPRSPLPPPPPSPPPICENVSESREQQEAKSGSPAVFCASPDVNDKADLFIKRFRDGLKLEKINSIKEKGKRKGKFGGEDDGIHSQI